MNDHYIVTIDRGHLRIFAEAKTGGLRTPRLEVVEAMDFPSVTNSSAEEQGRDSTNSDGSFDSRARRALSERGSHRGGEARRNLELIAMELDTFLQNRPEASWDFAAAPSLFRAVIDELSPPTRQRLRRVVPRTMINQRADEVRAHFAGTAVPP
jgi:hypothetical protein